MTSRTKLALAAVVLLLVLPMAAYADWSDGFDHYAAGTFSPSPWSVTDDTSACWSANTNVAYSGTAKSPPNVYLVTYTTSGSCLSLKHHLTLALPVNASSNVVSYSIYFASLSYTGALNGTSSIQFYLCSPGYLPPSVHCSSGSQDPASPYPVSSISGSATWGEVSGSVVAVPGDSYVLALYVQVHSAVTAVSFSADDFALTGANVETTDANFFMFDCQAGTWFNIAAYPGSYVKVSYPSSAPVYFYNVTIPDLVVDTHGASLVTVWVGTDYFVTILPGDTNVVGVKNKVYLCPPATEVFYELQVQDLSGLYPPGSMIFLNDTTLGFAHRTLASGYVDSYNQFGVWSVPGSYTVQLRNGDNVFSGQINLPSESGQTIPIQILKVVSNSQCQTSCVATYGAGFNPALTDAVVTFNDSSDYTTTITAQLWKQNASGLFELYTTTSTGTFGTFQHSFSCDSDACNSSIASQLSVSLSWNGAYGPSQVSLAVSGGGGFFGLPPDISGSLAGLSTVLPDVPWAALIGLCIVYVFAGVFGALSAKFGAIAVSMIVGLMTFEGWFSGLNPGAVLLLNFATVVSFIGFLRRGR